MKFVTNTLKNGTKPPPFPQKEETLWVVLSGVWSPSSAPTFVSSTVFASRTMALQAGRFVVYVAFNFVILALFSFTSAALASGTPNLLLHPYDFLYYSGVRAYFSKDWGKAAELLEKSITTKESLLRVRRQCHNDCMAAGREAFKKLGKSEGYKNYIR